MVKTEHRQGKQHGNADALSRRSCKDCKKCERVEKRECPKETDAPLCNAVKKKWEAQNSSTSHDRAEQWLKGLNMSGLRDAQLADDNIRPVVQWKESKEGRPE